MIVPNLFLDTSSIWLYVSKELVVVLGLFQGVPELVRLKEIVLSGTSLWSF